jgi:hypothetical protein
MTKLDEISEYLDSLPTERRNILLPENLDVLLKYKVDNYEETRTFEFPNGYGVSFWYSSSPSSEAYGNGSYSLVVFCNQGEIILEENNLYQVKCWLKTWDVMNLPEHVDPKSGEKIIAQIRSKCNNLDDLAKIKAAIECMMDELA